MRNSILGFSQKKALEYKLDTRDLLLLDYIINAIANPMMEHEMDANNNTYVWLSHSKILSDLPILDIKEDMFKKALKKLVDLGLLQTIRKHNAHGRGSKTYYGITVKCNDLCYEDDQVENITPEQERPGVKNYTSDNKLISNIDNTNNINIISRTSSRKNKNLFEKCSDVINEFTNNTRLKDVLITYLKFRLEVKDKPLYTNQFKGMLNKLNTLADNCDDMIKIVQQSLDNAWLSFYPLKNYNKSKDARVDIEQLGTTYIPRMSDEEKEELQRRADNGELETF